MSLDLRLVIFRCDFRGRDPASTLASRRLLVGDRSSASAPSEARGPDALFYRRLLVLLGLASSTPSMLAEQAQLEAERPIVMARINITRYNRH